MKMSECFVYRAYEPKNEIFLFCAKAFFNNRENVNLYTAGTSEVELSAFWRFDNSEIIG
jgi:hypothetical protein